MKRMNVDRARGLRLGMTDAEQVLWYRLRNRQLDGCKFRRQHEIDRYVVDFRLHQADAGDRARRWPAFGTTG
jgi:very-short-patch-repair endonuclease